jgi:hypothetical protein
MSSRRSSRPTLERGDRETVSWYGDRQGHLAPCGRAGELEVTLGDISIPPPGRGFELVQATPDERLALKAAGYRFVEAGDEN